MNKLCSFLKCGVDEAPARPAAFMVNWKLGVLWPGCGSITLLLILNTAVAKDLQGDDQRWQFLSSSSADSMIQYLHEYPDGRHVEEARVKLKAQNSKPLARLTSATAECKAAIPARIKSLLDQRSWSSKYDFQVPEDYFLGNSTITFVPKGSDAESTPIEDHVTLNLVALRRGSCMLSVRWSGFGSGLPEGCRCAPLQQDYVFDIPHARGALSDYSKMSATKDICLGNGVDHSKLVDDYLSIFIQRDQSYIERMRKKIADGAVVSPAEKGELEEIEDALPVIQKKTVNVNVYDLEKVKLMSWTVDVRSEFCKVGFKAKVLDLIERMNFIAP